MIAVGVLHFVDPVPFTKIVPPGIGDPTLLVLISGFFEIAGGVGLLIPKVRAWAGYGLIALFVAVFPANIYMALNDIAPTGQHLPAIVLWGRLPFQFVFIALAWWVSRPEKPVQTSPHE